MKEIRLGTIGSGTIVHSILDNVSVTEGIRLVAVYSRSMGRGRELAQAYGADRAYNGAAQYAAKKLYGQK